MSKFSEWRKIIKFTVVRRTALLKTGALVQLLSDNNCHHPDPHCDNQTRFEFTVTLMFDHTRAKPANENTTTDLHYITNVEQVPLRHY